MATIDSSFLRSHSRSIDELEKDYETQKKRLAKKSEVREKRMEENQRKEIAKRDRELESTTRRLKESYNESLGSLRQEHKAEKEALKTSTYNRLGKTNGLEAEGLKEQLENTYRALEAKHQSFQQKTADLERAYEDRMESQARNHASEVTKMREESKRDLSERLEERTQQQKELTRREVEAQKDKYQKLSEKLIRDNEDVTREARKAVDDTHRRMETRLERASKSHYGRSEELALAQNLRSEEQAKNLSRSRREETAELRQQLATLQELSRSIPKKENEAIQRATSDYEQDWITKLKTQQLSHESELAKSKRQTQEVGDTLGLKNRELLESKDQFLAKTLARQNQESHLERKELEHSMKTDREQLVRRMELDRDLSEKRQSNLVRNLEEQKTQAMDQQARSFQSAALRNREVQMDRLGQLERALSEARSTEDPSMISPAAEASIRKSVTRDYEQKLQGESSRNARQADSIQKSYSERLRELVLEKDSERAKQAQLHAFENQATRQEFSGQLREMQMNRDETLRNSSQNHDRELELQSKEHAKTLKALRNQYEDLFRQQSNEFRLKLASQRQELEFENRILRRKFSSELNETTRNFEKRLTDQKEAYESLLKDERQKSAVREKELERHQKAQLADQQRSFDQRLTQLESQQQERERVIARNQEEALERVKRSHALLMAKKS
jgi:hypothetical protein